MRMKGGLAGFPNRVESDYDTFGVGHSSTSISAALGMALAVRRQRERAEVDGTDPGERRRVVAVIGDGALTAGLAYEALNHAGGVKADMLVVLNDNDMSISPNVGAMNKYLARMMSGKLVTGAREGRQEGAREGPDDARARPAHRGARQGHGRALHPVRGARVQLLRPGRRARRRHPRRRPAEPPRHARPGVPALRDQEGARLPLRRGGPARAARGHPVRPGHGQGAQELEVEPPDLHQGVRRLGHRRGRGGRARRRDHPRDARGLGPRRVRAALPPIATTTSASPSSTR